MAATSYIMSTQSEVFILSTQAQAPFEGLKMACQQICQGKTVPGGKKGGENGSLGTGFESTKKLGVKRGGLLEIDLYRSP